MTTLIWMLMALAVGLAVGVYVTKYPEETRNALKRLGEKVKSLFAGIKK